jgi:hypothetical protein
MAFLVKDSVAGKLRFVNGNEAAGKGIYLNDVTVNTLSAQSLIGVDPTTKNAEQFQPDLVSEFPSLPVVETSGSNVVWRSLEDLIISVFGLTGSCGILAKDCTTGDLVGIPGNEGDILQFLSGSWTASPPGTIPGILNSFGFQGLQVTNNSNSIVAVTINKVIVQNVTSTTQSILLNTVSVAADISLSGAGGLDAGVESSNVWYYIYVIYNGISPAAIISASAVQPAMPAGYTYFSKVGVVRNNGSSDFVSFQQRERTYTYFTQIELTLGSVPNTATLISGLSDALPVEAISLFGNLSASVSTGSNGYGIALSHNTSTTINTSVRWVSASVASDRIDSPVYTSLTTPQQLYWFKIVDATNPVGGLLSINGFELSL